MSSEKKVYIKIWLGVFLYILLASLSIQLIILPHLLPQWHAGDGLLVGGDWNSFHRYALEVSDNIEKEGWLAWELKPQGQAPAGIAAAIYTITNISKPWIVLPLNALMHAFAAIILFSIVNGFIRNNKIALLAILPFVFFPSAMTWNATMHKDGFMILGSLCFLKGFIIFARSEQWEKRWSYLLMGSFFIVMGSFLVWIVRPYAVQMMFGVGIAMAAVLTLFYIFNTYNRKLSSWSTLKVITIIWLSLILVMPFTKGGIIAEVPPVAENRVSTVALYSVQGEALNEVDLTKIISGKTMVASGGNKVASEINWNKTKLGLPNYLPFEVWYWILQKPRGWQTSEIIPNFIENKIYGVAGVRNGSRNTAGFSNIDGDIGFTSVKDVLFYTPRAMQIFMFAPFPTDWFVPASMESNAFMRKVSAMEMIIVYISIVFLFYAIWHWRNRIELWILLIFSTGMGYIFTISVVNIGSLYRIRFGFLMTLVALGFAGLCLFINNKYYSEKSNLTKEISFEEKN